MIKKVARALGDDLLEEVAFVGGSATALLVSDEAVLPGIRMSDDVDLIVDVVGHVGWAQFQERLRERGFSHNPMDKIICRMRLDGLIVDFMPDDEDILGFGNRWYKSALTSAQSYRLAEDVAIRLVAPAYFVATKLEAYKGRGDSDPRFSRDMEDILTVLDGRVELTDEIKSSEEDVRTYIADEIRILMRQDVFQEAVVAIVREEGRSRIVLERLDAIASPE